MCCQISSVSNAFRPMTIGARLATRSGEPPSPTPVIPASVSTRMIMLLWLKAAVRLFRFDPVLGVSTRTLVTMALGNAAAARARAGGVRSCAACAHTGLSHGRRHPPTAPTARDFANVLRSDVHLSSSGQTKAAPKRGKYTAPGSLFLFPSSFFLMPENKKARPDFSSGLFLRNTPGSDLLSHGVSPTVPSAVAGLTSVFGMGTGVALLL